MYLADNFKPLVIHKISQRTLLAPFNTVSTLGGIRGHFDVSNPIGKNKASANPRNTFSIYKALSSTSI